MKGKIIGFLFLIATGGLLMVTFAPVNDMSIISQNSSAMLAATSNTSAYVSATGNIDRYQDIQLFLFKVFWFVIAMGLMIVGIWQVVSKPDGE
jgi:ascorbate-specific PTS system EIIC-type component UlaA